MVFNRAILLKNQTVVEFKVYTIVSKTNNVGQTKTNSLSMKIKNSVRHFDNLNNKYHYRYPLYLISVSAKRISQNNEYLTIFCNFKYLRFSY